MLSALTGEAAGETDWIERQAASVLKKNTPAEFPSGERVQASWSPSESIILKSRFPWGVAYVQKTVGFRL